MRTQPSHVLAIVLSTALLTSCQSPSGTEPTSTERAEAGPAGTESVTNGHEDDPRPEASTEASLAGEEIDVRIGIIDWTRDYDRGLAIAKRLGKPVLLHFGEHPG